MIVSNEFTKHYFTSGDDNILKAYEHYPSDNFDKIDWKKSAVKPGFELKDSHAIKTTCSANSSSSKYIVTGGSDGMIIIRSAELQPGTDQFECIKAFSAHSVSMGGVFCISIDQTGQFVYSAGGDGSIMVHAVGNS